MIDGSNTTVFKFERLPGTRPADLPTQFDVRLTLRVDIEDRNFHSETHRNGGAEFHFQSHVQPLQNAIGFAFTPAPDRQLRVLASAGAYRPEPEWCQGIPHPVEQSRAQVGAGDAYSPGWFDIPLVKDSPASLILTAETLRARNRINSCRRWQSNRIGENRSRTGETVGRRFVRPAIGDSGFGVRRASRPGPNGDRRLPVVFGLGP